MNALSEWEKKNFTQKSQRGAVGSFKKIVFLSFPPLSCLKPKSKPNSLVYVFQRITTGRPTARRETPFRFLPLIGIRPHCQGTRMAIILVPVCDCDQINSYINK
jgi:hypothetical protein